ncbi:hypothetical protein [Sphingobium sp.]|uniref:hypothetical protein n=1 Tax=Sphingobium sp. TaxID=1912891 RepID=UPI003BB4B401
MIFTLNDIALLVVVLLAGLVLGMMMSGRGKYKRAWHDEQAAHRQTIKDRDARIAAADARMVEMERRPAVVAPAAVAGTAVAGSAVADSDHGRDDLSRINGIGQTQETVLNEAGYHRYAQIAALNAEQEGAIEARLGLKPGTIAHEDWRQQAHALDTDTSRGGLFGRSATPV